MKSVPSLFRQGHAAIRAVRAHAPYWLGAAIACLLLATWPEPPDTAATRDAQAAAEQRARWLRAARQQCREAYGPTAQIFESPEGDLICRRRPAGPVA